jgi:uncharacterized membrane protein
MIAIWLFLHLLGVTMWLGGGFASMLIGLASRSEERSALGTVARVQWRVSRLLVLPGALLTVFTGLLLTFRLMHSSAMGNPWMVLMQVIGIVGALLALFVSVPTAARVARIDPLGQHAAYFDRLRTRLKIVGSISGTMGLIAMLAAAVYRYGA